MRIFVRIIFLLSLPLLSIYAQTDYPAITAEELKGHVEYLASEELAGRKPGTEGDRKAAEYIRSQLEKNNLRLLGDEGYQYFDIMKSLELDADNHFSFDGQEAAVGSDYMPLAFSENGTVKTGAVFVGYGFQIETDSLVWNDYENVDVKDKLAVILRGSPEEDSHASVYLGHTDLRKKILRAKDNGAAGVIFVSGRDFDSEDVLLDLNFEKRSPGVGILVVHAKRDLLDKILSGLSLDTGTLEKFFLEERVPNSFELPVEVEVKVELKKIYESTRNVLAVLEGSDPVLKDEYIVIGAHYDHLGMGGQGSGSRVPDTSAVHYGADDNASGVSAALEIIERLTDRREAVKRSVLFVAFGAEEMGLLGSKYFTENPPVELSQINCMMNFDMVGRLDPEDKGLTIGGSGTSAKFAEILNPLVEKGELSVRLSPEGYGPSDHASFYSRDIPVLFFFTGVHEDYHTYRDTYEKLNYEGEKSVADLGYEIAFTLSNLEERLAFQEAGPKKSQMGQYSFKVTLGIMPDVAGTDVKGLRADAVIEGRPAYRAGMQKGDIIVAMDGKPVNDIYEYMNRLSDFKPGQRISVDVLRDGKKVILIVDL